MKKTEIPSEDVLMRNGNKEYGICKQACLFAGCFCPKENEFHNAVANTPAFIREYFLKTGFEKRLKTRVSRSKQNGKNRNTN